LGKELAQARYSSAAFEEVTWGVVKAAGDAFTALAPRFDYGRFVKAFTQAFLDERASWNKCALVDCLAICGNKHLDPRGRCLCVACSAAEEVALGEYYDI